MAIQMVNEGQGSADMTLQYCGSLEYWFQMAQANNVSLTDGLKAGSNVTMPEVVSNIATYFGVEKVIIATGRGTVIAGRKFGRAFGRAFG